MTSEHRAEVDLPGPAATRALGRWLGERLRPGQVLGLVGTLGAGKTLLAQGLAEGLGLDDPGAVCSPTYLLVIEHPGPVPLLHADAYLPQKLAGFLRDGGLDYLTDRNAVVAVEWADRVTGFLPPDTLWLHLDEPTGGGRRAELRTSAPEGCPWLADLPRMFPGD